MKQSLASFSLGVLATALVTFAWMNRPIAETPAPDQPVMAGTTSKAPAPRSRARKCNDLELNERIRDLEGQLALCQSLVSQQQNEFYGEVESWPMDTPAHLLPDAFTAQVEKAAAECTGFGLDLVDVRCDEPPCVAMFRTEPGAQSMGFTDFVNNCAQWSEPFGTMVQSSTGQADCEDGSTERYVMLTVPTDEILGKPEDRTEQSERFKRINARTQELRSQWRCAGS